MMADRRKPRIGARALVVFFDRILGDWSAGRILAVAFFLIFAALLFASSLCSTSSSPTTESDPDPAEDTCDNSGDDRLFVHSG
jgi:hypothetical protein